MKQETQNHGFNGGLVKSKPDSRDFSYTKVFGAIPIELIPDTDFIVAEPLKIKDQKNTDFCVAAATCAVSEDQENVVLSMEWFFAQIKKLTGDIEKWGTDLRSACKVACNTGFIEKEKAEYSLEKHPRNWLADYKNWDEELGYYAGYHRKKSYFKPDGYKDTFDAFRTALWTNKSHKRSILTGVVWKNGWSNAKNGIISKEQRTPLMGHALKICGQKMIDNEIYLTAQLSNGEEIGDKGMFYFPREVINRDFTYGAYLFVDADPNEVKKICWSWWQRVWQKIIQFIKNYLEKLN